MSQIQEAEVSSIFNHMFSRFSKSGTMRLERLREDVGDLTGQLELTDDLHATLTHIGVAAGHGKHEYGAVSRAFTEMAELVIAGAAQTSGAQRQFLQHDACVLLSYAEISAPRGLDGLIANVYADPIVDTAIRLIETQPEPHVEQIVSDSTAVLHTRLVMTDRLREKMTKGAPHLDALARAAQNTLRRHMH